MEDYNKLQDKSIDLELAFAKISIMPNHEKVKVSPAKPMNFKNLPTGITLTPEYYAKKIKELGKLQITSLSYIDDVMS